MLNKKARQQFVRYKKYPVTTSFLLNYSVHHLHCCILIVP